MSKKNLILYLFILFKLVIQYLAISDVYELHRDEFLHIDQGKHLAWGYLSVPPFTSWISYLIIFFGGTEFWVKFFPAMFGVLTLIVVWKATEELKGGIFALVLGALAVTASVLLRINLLYQPNSFDILAWTFLNFTVIKYINSGKNKWLYFAAVTFAIGFLNKYNIAFQLAGLLPAILITQHRNLFVNRHLYLSLALALLLIAPNLIWQYENNFPVVHHMEELEKTQLVNVQRADFLKEQLLFFISSLFVLIAAFVSFFRYGLFFKYRLFFWSFLFTLCIYVSLKAKGYYAIGLYPILLAFGSVYLEYLWQRFHLKWLPYVAIATVLLLSIPLLRIALPTYTPSQIRENPEPYERLGLLRWEDGKNHTLPQDFADMLGWKELAAKVDYAYDVIADPEHTLILCDNYGQAGAINFYSRHKNIGAISFNADYIDWAKLDKPIRHIVLVQNANDDDKNREREKPMFRKVAFTGKIENLFAREVGTSVYILQDARVNINDILKKELDQKRW